MLAPLLLSLAAQAALPSPLAPDRTARWLDALERRGSIDPAGAGLLRTLNGPAGAAGTMAHCGTVELMALKGWAGRNGVAVRSNAPPSAGYLESPILPLRVYYDVVAHQAMAQSVLTLAEAAWQREIVELGYPAPFQEDDSGTPVTGMRYYIGDLGGQAAGVTEPLGDVPSTPRCDCSSQIVIEAMLEGYTEELAATVYHEFNHTTQAATDCAESLSAWENFASAAELNAYPGEHTMRYAAIPEFQQWCDQSVDFWTQNFGGDPTQPTAFYQYGAALFPIFLQERYGGGDPAFPGQVWSSFAQDGTVAITPFGYRCSGGNHPDWLQGVDAVMQSKGTTLSDAFAEFSAWRSIVGSRDDGHHYPHGAEYREPPITATYARVPTSGDLGAAEYGSRYVAVDPAAVAGKRIRVRVEPANAEAQWTASLLFWRDGQETERLPLSFGPDGKGSVIANVGADVTRIVLAVSQLTDGSHPTDDADYLSVRYWHYVIEYAPGDDAGLPGPDASEPDAAGVEPRDASEPDAAGEPSDASPGQDTSPTQCGCSAGTAGLQLAALAALGMLAARRRR